MRIARIFTGEDNQSHFEDVEIPLLPGEYGVQSAPLPTGGVIFRETPADGNLGFHPAPRCQFVITLSGMGEIVCGDGTRRRFGPGDVMLAEDTTGQGHITREVGGPRRGIFIPLSEDFDIGAWRTGASQ
jgi:hypothetical protein